MALARIGLFGGSFDPVHLAHLALARCAVDQLKLDRLLWVPAGKPWQKPGVTEAAHRLAMVRLMVEGEPSFAVDERELKREGASYTVDTVEELLAAHPGAELFLVIGQDQYARLPTWHRWQDLLRQVTLAVAARADEEVHAAAEVAAVSGKVQRLAMPAMHVSSTEVREKVSRGEDIRPLVGDAVAQYISRHRLYNKVMNGHS